MAYGGGVYTVQNKILGGAYFKFSSTPQATATIADRGMSAMALDLNWGVSGKIFTLTAQEFYTDSLGIFGYEYSAPEMQELRELFLHTKEAHLYRLNGGGEKATCTYGTAVHAGVRGNDLKVVIVADEDQYIVSLYLGTVLLDKQTVATASDLVDNEWVVWAKEAELQAVAGMTFAGGTNGSADSSAHQQFLDLLEAYPDVNAVGYAGEDEVIKTLYVQWVKTMREDVGLRCQAVVFGKKADSWNVVNVKNQANLVPWVLGVQAGTAVNKSATNMVYDGELTVDTAYTQRELEKALIAGEFVLHQVGGEVRVLEDINSFVSSTDTEGDAFKDNQTIRIIDAYADSVANVFGAKYMGKVPNDEAGRISLWSDIVKILEQLEALRAIENFNKESIKVLQGDTKKSVLTKANFEVVNAMVRLYIDSTIQ